MYSSSTPSPEPETSGFREQRPGGERNTQPGERRERDRGRLGGQESAAANGEACVHPGAERRRAPRSWSASPTANFQVHTDIDYIPMCVPTRMAATANLSPPPPSDLDVIEFRWSRTLPYFILAMAAASLAIFNYQKSSSPVTAATLYALRTSAKAREYLGDEIYFRQRIPWIWGHINQVKGHIDITFSVRGTKNVGVMRFKSRRPTPRGVYETLEWSLETDDGAHHRPAGRPRPVRAHLAGRVQGLPRPRPRREPDPHAALENCPACTERPRQKKCTPLETVSTATCLPMYLW